VTAAAQPRARARPKARERILAAAARRIAREGIDDVRIARIAMDAGVSPALVHYHYATREALLAEALDYSFNHAGEARISDGVPGTSAAQRLRAMIDQCLPTSPELEEDWVLWVELWLRAARHPELRPVAEDLYARLHDWFATEIAAGVQSEEFGACDPADVADRLLALIDGYGIRSLIGDSRVPVDRVRTAIWAALARDLGL
jgi:AcrR family transcriptional regulator